MMPDTRAGIRNPASFVLARAHHLGRGSSAIASSNLYRITVRSALVAIGTVVAGLAIMMAVRRLLTDALSLGADGISAVGGLICLVMGAAGGGFAFARLCQRVAIGRHAMMLAVLVTIAGFVTTWIDPSSEGNPTPGNTRLMQGIAVGFAVLTSCMWAAAATLGAQTRQREASVEKATG
jgi:hypothetical protein